MRIAGVGARPPAATDVAQALAGATALLGQRPAITGLTSGGRREQGFASLAGWVAKGANLLGTEFGVAPGDRIGLAGPPGWPLAAVALSAWWVGATIVPATAAERSTTVSVLHRSIEDAPPGGGERLWIGDELDGTGLGSPQDGEWWADAVTPHGDRPPPPANDGRLIALVTSEGVEHEQRTLLDAFLSDPGGALAVVRQGDEDVLVRPDAAALLCSVALRPLVTGSATVVLDASDPDRMTAAGSERVTRWYA